MRDPKSRHDGHEEAPAEIDPEGSSGSFVHRRMILGSALRTLAIGGLAAGGIVGCASTTRMLRSLPDPDLPRGGTGGKVVRRVTSQTNGYVKGTENVLQFF